MATKVLSDLGRVRSEQEWQSVTVQASVAVTKALNPVTTYTTGVYIGDWDKLQVVLSIASSATDAGDVLDCNVQFSMDNLAWYDAGAFTQQAGNGADCKQMMHFVPGTLPTDPNAIVIGGTLSSSTVIIENLRGRYIRLGVGVTDNDTNGTHTIHCMAMVNRIDTVRDVQDEIKELVPFPLLARTDALDDPVGVIYEIGDSWEWMFAVLRVTNHDTDAGDHLDVGIDLSVDGEMWLNVCDFTQCDGDDTAWVEHATFAPGLADNIDAILAVTAACGETVTRPGIAGAFLRARNTVTASGTDDETFTFALKIYVK